MILQSCAWQWCCFRGMCFSPPKLLKTIAQLFKKKKVPSGGEEEIKVFLPNHSAAQQRSLSRLSTSSYSVVKSLSPPVMSWEQGTCLLGLFLHPSDEMDLMHLGCVLQGAEPKFWHCGNTRVSSAVAQLLQKRDSAHLILLLLKMAPSVIFFFLKLT